MKELNLNNRLIMYAICTCLEYDIKSYIKNANSSIDFTIKMKEKISKRKKVSSYFSEDIDQLDLSDLIALIYKNPCKFYTNNDKVMLLKEYFDKIIPIRNRVMHTKPFEIGDKAILFAVLEDIGDNIPWIDWSKTIDLNNTLKNEPSSLVDIEFKPSINFDSNIMHNLPIPEFDDTGYIGRKKEQNDIKKLILEMHKNQIITVIGSGGIGKTAIVIKILYDLVDNEMFHYDAIIWITLKTRTLSEGEFIEIKDSISNLKSIFMTAEKEIIIEDNESPENNLLNFMKEFNTLLVLDNLETLNDRSINNFLKAISSNSKVLITSRLGIGELENRYPIEKMKIKDSVIYFRELSKYFGLSQHMSGDNEISIIIRDHLYSNPLAIKWYMSGIYKGLSQNEILSQKDKLVEFCMSNIFNKLSNTAKDIIHLFLIENYKLVFGEIDFYLNEDELETRKAINELFVTNIIKLNSGKYTLNEMMKDYLLSYNPPNNNFIKEFYIKKKKLNTMLQEIKVKIENDPFNPKSIFSNINDTNKKLSSYYLMKALESSKVRDYDSTCILINKAMNIAPDYFEVYKIKAFISAERRDIFDALENYRIALAKCDSDIEKASVLCLFAVFYVIRLNEYDKALELINEANEILPNETFIELEKARVLMYLGRYDECETLMLKIETKSDSFNDKLENIFYSRCADLFRRKAEVYRNRDVSLKLELLTKGISEFDKITNTDYKSISILVRILCDLTYLFSNADAIRILVEVVDRYSDRINSNRSKHKKILQERIIEKEQVFREKDYLSLNKAFIDYKMNAKEIKEDNKGLIISMQNSFGFIENYKENNIYFKTVDMMDDLKVGDFVTFETIRSERSDVAICISKIPDLE